MDVKALLDVRNPRSATLDNKSTPNEGGRVSVQSLLNDGGSVSQSNPEQEPSALFSTSFSNEPFSNESKNAGGVQSGSPASSANASSRRSEPHRKRKKEHSDTEEDEEIIELSTSNAITDTSMPPRKIRRSALRGTCVDNLRRSSIVSGRGVTQHFSTQVSRIWTRLPMNVQKTLISLSIFPSSFSTKAASAIQLTNRHLGNLSGRDLMNRLTDTGIVIIDAATGRGEINDRIRTILRQKAAENHVDMKNTKRAFIKHTLKELKEIERRSRESDSIRTYTISANMFEKEKLNILLAFELEEFKMESEDSWLTGSYVMRFCLEPKNRIELYQHAMEALCSKPTTGSREEKRYTSKLLFAFGRAQMDDLNAQAAKEPLMHSLELLKYLVETSTSTAETTELCREMAIVHQSVAKLHNELGEHEAALDYVMKCLVTRKSNGEAGNVPYAICLGILSETLIFLRNYSGASTVIIEQLKMLEKNNMQNSHEYANALKLLADVRYEQDDLENAKSTLITALDRLQKSSLPYKNYSFLEGRILEELGNAISQEGNHSGGTKAYQLASRSYLKAGLRQRNSIIAKLGTKRSSTQGGHRNRHINN